MGAPPTFTSSTIADFGVGMAGSFTVTTSGSPVAPIHETGTLPRGLSFVDNGNGTATLSGTPKTAVSYHVSLSATNSLGSATQALTIVVQSAPEFITSASAIFGVGAKKTFTVLTRSNPPATLSLVSGSLPQGLAFVVGSSTGKAIISGTPANGAAGTYAVIAQRRQRLRASRLPDARPDGGPGTHLHVAALADLPINHNDSFDVVTSPGVPVATTLDAAMPKGSGLSFHDNGDGTATISGVAALAKTYLVKVTASNGVAKSVQDLSVVIQSVPVFGSAAFTTMVMGRATSFTVRAESNPKPTLSLVSGSLPAGLVFTSSPSSGTGTISGTPAAGAEGTATLTIDVDNGYATTPQIFTLTVKS